MVGYVLNELDETKNECLGSVSCKLEPLNRVLGKNNGENINLRTLYLGCKKGSNIRL